MKVKDLLEAEEKSLVGMTIEGKKLPVEGKWEGGFYCSGKQLTSLEGAPSSVGGNFFCSDNQLTSLEDIHRQIKKIGGKFYCDDNPIKSHVLGLLLIDGLTEVTGDKNQLWVPILNQAIKQFSDKRKRVRWAQAELVKQLGEEGKALAQL